VSDPRHAAIETLLEIDRTSRTAKQVWDGARAGAETALVLGVLRRRGTLDAVLAAYSTRKLPLIKPPTLAILRAGLYELLYMGDSPVHAVVNASVESVKRLGRYKDLGFVNAMLRSIARGRKHDLVFTRSVFPNPEHDPAGYLAARGSTALWIARRRHAELGLERALKVLDLQASTPPLFVRSDIELDLPAGPNPGLYIADARLGDLFERFGSHIVVQDAVASQVAPFVAPAAGSRVLDYCSAPGGKATHLAQLVGPEGHVSAWDASAERLELVAENAERLGLAQLVCEEPSGEYAAVLVDAPCSNTGVLARRPEARWRVKERHIKGMVERQIAILRRAAGFVEPGGTLVYSTCSLEPEENLGVVEAFVALGGFRLDEARTVYPDEAHGDGGFMARLRS
jgi:16S rRNA (cytosine967-C5)-methyltransferase